MAVAWLRGLLGRGRLMVDHPGPEALTHMFPSAKVVRYHS